MSEIVQKLGFDASEAIANLASFSYSVGQANSSLKQFQGTAAARSSFNKTNKDLKKTKNNATDLTVSWQTMIRVIQTQLIVRGLNAIITSLQDATERARELGLAIAEIQTIGGGFQTGQAITDDVLAISDATGKTAKDIAEGVYQTLSNQVVEAGEALNFTAQAAKLATVTVSKTGDAVNALSSVMNAYELNASQAEHVSGVLFKTVELGRIRLSELANTIGRVTPLASQLGITYEELLAALTTMTRQGVKTDTAITQTRAVLNKLIAPSQDLLDLYEKWNVETGEQAIETFGGLTGLLQEITKETRGSSTELSKYFRRVRATSGVMSLMNDEGQLAAENLKEIQEGTTAAANAWEEFAKTDAQRLTQASQELENIMTRIGLKLLPALATSMSAFNDMLEMQYDFWFRIVGGINVADKAANTYHKNVEEGLTRIEVLRKRSAEAQREFYSDLTRAASQYYNVLDREEDKIAAKRDRNINVATDAFNKVGDNVLDVYESNLEGLRNFVSKANDEILSGTQQIADIQRQINANVLDERLEKAGNVFGRLRVLEDEYFSQRRKAAQAFSEVDASKESKERALQEIEIARQLNQQALETAKQTGHLTTIQKFRDRDTELLRQKQNVIKRNNDQIENNIDSAKDEIEVYKEGLTVLEDRLKRIKELAKDGLIDGGAAKAQITELASEIRQVLSRADNSKLFLDSIGIERNIGLISGSLEEAFNAAEIDWLSEIDRAKQVFAKEVIPVRIAFDPTGEREQAAAAFGIRREDYSSLRDFHQAINEEAKRYGQIQDEVNGKIDETSQKLQTDVKTALQNVLGISRAREESARKTANREADSLALAGRLAGIKEREAFVTKRTNDLLSEQNSLANNLEKSFLETATKLREGKTLEDGALRVLKERVTVAENLNQITSKEADAYNTTLNALTNASQLQKEINDLQAILPEKDKAEAANRVLSLLNGQREAQREGVNLAAKAKEELDRARDSVSGLNTNMWSATRTIGQASEQARLAATNVSAIGTNATSILGSLQSVVNKLNQVKQAAIEAAQAQAQVAAGGGAAQYFGGPMKYFAAGGITRGQDKIPTVLSRGETVINSKNSRRFFSELNAMNQGSQPVFREQGGSVTNVGDVNVTVNGGDSSQQTVREIGRALRREIQRGNIKLR
jgi:TP901 family phage tail tape measure protein